MIAAVSIATKSAGALNGWILNLDIGLANYS